MEHQGCLKWNLSQKNKMQTGYELLKLVGKKNGCLDSVSKGRNKKASHPFAQGCGCRWNPRFDLP